MPKNVGNGGFTRYRRELAAAELDIPIDLAVGLDAPLLGMLCATMLDGLDRQESGETDPETIRLAKLNPNPSERLIQRVLDPEAPVSTRQLVGEMFGLMADAVTRTADDYGVRDGGERGRAFPGLRTAS